MPSSSSDAGRRARILAPLADAIVAVRVPHPTRVGIDGVDAAGKTTLADELAALIMERGRVVIRASCDSFHRPAAERYVLGRDSPVGFYRDSFDYEALRRVLLVPLGPGGSRRYRVGYFDSVRDEPVDAPEQTAPADAVLVFDGVFLARPQLADCWDYRIFVAIEEGESVRRGAKRDAWFLGGEDEARRRYERRYVPGQRLYLEEARPLETADAVVDNADPASPSLRHAPRGHGGNRHALGTVPPQGLSLPRDCPWDVAKTDTAGPGRTPDASRLQSGPGRRLVPLSGESRTYDAAGVSLAKAEEIVARLRGAVESTGAQGFGAFAGLYPLDDRRLLAASTDSVGSKLILARRAGRLDWAGMDLAAHCINDVITTGADPLFMLDYVAAASIDLDQVAELVEGAAKVCRDARCALIGGETAELPGIYRDDELDFAGTCVGVVDRDRLIDGSRCQAGDIVIGLPSSGLHTNGFTLVRELVDDEDFDADLLLAPHRLYVDDVRKLIARTDVKALAHVTGGGILGNLTRVLPDGVEPRIDWDAWERPPVFAWLADRGVDEEELRRVFNVGIGMCAVVAEAPSDAIVIGELA
jgi:phosphoribosylformylglycinamidine cyclo-ligase